MSSAVDEPKRGTSVRKSLGWMAAGQGAYFALQFVSSVVLARLLTPYEVGIFSLGLAVVGMITVIQSIGLNSYLIREPNLSPEVSSTVFSVNLLVALFLTLMICGSGFAGSWMFGEIGVLRVLLWLSITPILAAAGFLPLTLLEREGDFRLVSLIKTGSTLLGTAATVLLALAGHSYMSFAYGQVISSAASTAAALSLAPQHARFQISFGRWREIQRFALNMLTTSGVSRLAARLQDMLLGRLLGLSTLGLYSRAGNVFNMLWENVFLVVSRVAFVDFANIARGGGSLGPRYQQALELITALMWPAFAGLAVLSGPFISTVYGPKWLAVAVPLSLLCVVGFIYVAVAMTWELFVIAGETSRQARIEVVRSIVGVALFAAGCTVSIEAAAAARAAEAAFAFVLYMPHVVRITGVHSRDLRRIYGRSLLLTVLAIGPSVIAMSINGWSPETSLTILAEAIALGLVLWGVGLRLMNHPLSEEMVGLSSRRVRSARPAEIYLQD